MSEVTLTDIEMTKRELLAPSGSAPSSSACASPVDRWPRVLDEATEARTPRLCHHPNADTKVTTTKSRYAGNEWDGFRLKRPGTTITRVACPDCQTMGICFGDRDIVLSPGIITGE